MRVPDGVERLRWAGVRGWTVPEARSWVLERLTRWGTLVRAAEHEDDPVLLRGRGVVRAIAAPPEIGGRWVVRPYLRGGWMARVNHDRFLAIGARRPEKEMWAGIVARGRQIRTPKPIAALWYRRGPFYRAEILTEWVPDSVDLAGLLFHDRWPGEAEPAPVPVRHESLRGAGAMISQLARAGLHHRDMNAKNLLVARGEGEVVVHALDLDRCRIHPGPIANGVMAARLERSLKKFEEETSRAISEAGWAAFYEGLAEGPSE